MRFQFDRAVLTALLALMLVLAIGALFHADGAFHKWATHRDTLRQASVKGILACGMTVVILLGGIDLAVGSVLAVSAVLFSLATIHWELGAWTGLALCLAIGAACGGITGLLTARAGFQPFVASLALMVIARGFAKLLSGGSKIANYVTSADGSIQLRPMPPAYEILDSRWFGGNVAVVTLIFLACAVVTQFALARTAWGRFIYAIGGNEVAARLAGVPVVRIKLTVYAFCGMMAGLAGICQAAQEQQGDPEAGVGYELDAISMVVIGGTSLMGGRGGVGLTLIGVLTIGYIEKILSINAVAEATRLMLTGGIVILAVLVQRRRAAA